MNNSHLSRLVEWAVVAAVAALHGLIAFGSRQQPDVGWLQFASDTQPMALVTLVVAWAVLGPGWLWVRVIAGPLLLVGWAVAMAAGDRRFFNPADSEFPFPLVVALAAIVVIAAIRLGGLRMVATAAGRPEPRPQFSIFTLLLATTLIAAAIGCLELLRPKIISVGSDNSYADLVRQVFQVESQATFGRLEILRGLVPLPASLRQLVLSMAIASCAAGGLAVVLRPGTIWLRLVIVVVALPTLALYLTHLPGTAGDEFVARTVDLTVALAATAALAGVSVLPLRLMGLRLGRSPTLRVGHAAEKSTTQLQQPIADFKSNESLARTECGPTLELAETQA